MKFYTLKEIPIARDDIVFKASPLSSFLAMLVFFGISIALLLFGKHGGYFKHGWDVPAPFAYVISGVCGLVALVLFGALRGRLKPTNWLLRCNATSVIIKYRAYQNWRMPADDVQAVGLDYSEIAWARKVSERRVSQERQENQVQSLTFLDFGLIRPDTSDLQRRFDDERKRPWSFRSLTYPVEVLPGGIVRLQWSSAGGGKSNLDKALQWLAASSPSQIKFLKKLN